MINSSKFAGLAAGVSLAALSAATAASAQPLANPLMVATVRAQADEPAAPVGNFLRPRIGLQVGVTDNVTSSATNKKSDTIGRVTVGLESQYDSPRAQVNVSGDVVYDVYAKNQKYDTLSFNGAAVANYVIVPQTLAIEAAGAQTQGSASTFGSTDFYRGANPNDYQIGTYYVGPHLTISPGIVDVSAAARFGQVFFDGSDASTFVPLSDTTSFYQLIGAADTKNRLGRVRFVTSGQYQRDDADFDSTAGSVSTFYQATDRFTGIVRLGYDNTKLNNVQKLNAPFWAVGGQFLVGSEGFIRVEGGQRYDKPYWAGQAQFKINPRVTLIANYSNTLESGALAVNNVLVDYVGDLNEPLPIPNFTQNFRLNTTYFDAAAINRTGSLRAFANFGRQTVDFMVMSTEQKYLTATAKYRTVSETVTYQNQVRPDLMLGADFTHANGTFGGRLPGTAGRAGDYYQTSLRARYGLNSRTNLTAVYQNRRSRSPAATLAPDYDENVASIAIIRQF